MVNRRWAIIAGLGVVELWIVGLSLRSLSGDHAVSAQPLAAALPVSSAVDSRDGHAQSMETGSAPRVIIDDEDTALTVTVRPGSTVSVHDRLERHGWMHGDELPLRFEKTADGVSISRQAGGVVMMFGSLERQLDIVVPPEARLDVRNAGPTTVAGLRADAELHSDDGSIAVSDHRGRLHVTTGNGRIELSDVEAPFIETGSDNGRITFDRVRTDGVAITSDNGRIDIGRSLVRGGKIQTDNGRVALGLDSQSDVTISARTSSGRVIADPPLRATSGGDEDGAPVLIRIGTGSGRLDVGSDDGSISIRAGGVERS